MRHTNWQATPPLTKLMPMGTEDSKNTSRPRGSARCPAERAYVLEPENTTAPSQHQQHPLARVMAWTDLPREGTALQRLFELHVSSWHS